MSEPIDEPVPKLPRGRGLKFSGPELFRILLTLLTLVGVVVLARPCAHAVSGFVTSFDGSEDTKQQMPKPGSVDVPAPPPPELEVLRPDMTEEELKAAIERSKARAAGASGGAPSGAPSSSAPSGAPSSSAPSGAPSSSAPSGTRGSATTRSE